MPTPLQQMMLNLMREITGAAPNSCLCCGSTATAPSDFKDDLSRKEYSISQMCQACQDKVFG
jgi:hypothetical protein